MVNKVMAWKITQSTLKTLFSRTDSDISIFFGRIIFYKTRDLLLCQSLVLPALVDRFLVDLVSNVDSTHDPTAWNTSHAAEIAAERSQNAGTGAGPYGIWTENP